MTHAVVSLPFAWAALAASIALGSFAQITLKHTTNTLGPRRQLGKRYKTAAPWMALWLVLFAGATVCWIVALRRLDLSYAYPLLSLGYVTVTALAVLMLNERVSRTHWIAVGLITCGAALVAGSV